MNVLYLLLNLGSISIPLIYSFNKKMNFIKHFKPLSIAITIIAILYIIWDIWFTKLGVWKFNPDYYIGYTLFGMPFEEYLFFFCIPYSSIFIHYSLIHFFPKASINNKATSLISLIITSLSLFVFVTNIDKAYTCINFLILSTSIILGWLFNRTLLSKFYISFLIILIPFLLVNGVLTGSFIDDQVVWYNDLENLNIRVGTIPIEDFGYAFSLLLLTLLIFEKLNKKS
ncbi:MAG: hypothetical protein BM557_04905 [Flavobacterium sp. MedPE-SWcel]|uniref:lycopene cyclase domain-containing protein n=1 Tax=uncultured Flavobacterium sp. TaxID=165435 RepID=UPI0009210A08|nr:lycopene cyclase domain-containing protein [uncultured Flavobacterium sp.]OIQ21098.1 MAG: hypothetical protein BM557_04905 [Flavobacterium sp. MedPE-SWcel]